MNKNYTFETCLGKLSDGTGRTPKAISVWANIEVEPCDPARYAKCLEKGETYSGCFRVCTGRDEHTTRFWTSLSPWDKWDAVYRGIEIDRKHVAGFEHLVGGL